MEQNNLAQIRIDYGKEKLTKSVCLDDPLEQFNKWMEQAIKAEVNEPTAMCLSTVDTSMMPNSRIVLLKGVDHGFQFFTNYSSTKGKEIQANPKASLNFFWPELERQVRIQGELRELDIQASDEYFNSRPKGSKIGAWVSRQSNEIENREVLEKREIEEKQKWDSEEPKRPVFWGGYRLIPVNFEFWQGRASRLHDRIKYDKIKNRWKKVRLEP